MGKPVHGCNGIQAGNNHTLNNDKTLQKIANLNLSKTGPVMKYLNWLFLVWNVIVLCSLTTILVTIFTSFFPCWHKLHWQINNRRFMYMHLNDTIKT